MYVLSGDKDPSVKGMDYFLEGIFRIRRRFHGPWKLKSIKGEARTFEYRLSMEPVRVPDAPVPLSEGEWYSREELHRYFSSGQNFNPLPTEPPYKARFDELLASHGLSEASMLVEDLERLRREVPDETEREILAKARIGQGKFRADLVAAWNKGEVCALTGAAIPELLIASHIKPWRESTNAERLDPMNGLLLAAHADRLFDRFLLSFEKNHRGFVSVLHPRIRSLVSGLGIRQGMELNTSHLGFSAEQRFEAYMRDHLKRHLQLVERDSPTS